MQSIPLTTSDGHRLAADLAVPTQTGVGGFRHAEVRTGHTAEAVGAWLTAQQ